MKRALLIVKRLKLLLVSFGFGIFWSALATPAYAVHTVCNEGYITGSFSRPPGAPWPYDTAWGEGFTDWADYVLEGAVWQWAFGVSSPATPFGHQSLADVKANWAAAYGWAYVFEVPSPLSTNIHIFYSFSFDAGYYYSGDDCTSDWVYFYYP
jgi:hypothetical protein